MISKRTGKQPNSYIDPKCNNSIDINQFFHVFLLKRGFVFPTIEDFKNVENWAEGVLNRNIVLFPNVQGVIDLSDQPEYERSLQDYDWLKSPGKYVWRIQFKWSLYFTQKMQVLSLKDYDICFFDVNKNLIGYSSDGISVQGFSTDIINFEIIKFGTTQIALTNFYIMLDDQTQFNINGISEKVDFKPKKLIRAFIEFVDFTIISESSVSFYVYDEESQIKIFGLEVKDFTFDDTINGILNIGTFAMDNDGLYTLSDVIPDITQGQLICSNFQYYGLVEYNNTAIPVDLLYGGCRSSSNPVVHYLIVRVQETGTGDPIVGLGNTDFLLINDSLFQSVIVSEFNNGDYALYSSFELTFGSLTLVDPDYTGSFIYNVNGFLLEENFSTYILVGSGVNPNNKIPGLISTVNTSIASVLLDIVNYQYIVDITSIYCEFIIPDLIISVDYTFTIDIDSIGLTGSIYVNDGTSDIAQYTTAGIKILNFTATTVNLTLRLSFLGGNLNTILNSFKLVKT